jgi:hypothetical protein
MVLGVRTNKAYCRVCHDKPLSNIDLAVLMKNIPLKEAVAWMLKIWSVPAVVQQRRVMTGGSVSFAHVETKSPPYLFEAAYTEKPTRNTVRNLFAHI